jgi:hypothetical protein
MKTQNPAKPAGKVEDEILERMPPAFKLIVEFVRGQKNISNGGNEITPKREVRKNGKYPHRSIEPEHN